MKLSLSAKIIIPVQAAFCIAILSAIALNYFKMERVVQDAVATRFQVVTSGLAKEIEGGLNLGFTLSSLRNLDALIERERIRDERIGGIVLFDDRGEVVFAAGEGAPQGTVPAGWVRLNQNAHQGGRSWDIEEEGTQVIGTAIQDVFGQPAGGIALSYSLGAVRQGVLATLPDLATAGIVVLVVCLALTAIAVGLLMRPTQRRLNHAAELLAEAEKDPGRAAEAGDKDELGLGIGDFLKKVAEVRGQLSQVDRRESTEAVP